MNLSLINTSYLEEVCGGSKEIIIDMIDIFREQVEEFSTELKKLLAEESYYDLGLLAHKAKSSVAIMGMEELAGSLKDLELKAKQGIETETYEGYVSNFIEQSRLGLEELEIYQSTLE